MKVKKNSFLKAGFLSIGFLLVILLMSMNAFAGECFVYINKGGTGAAASTGATAVSITGGDNLVFYFEETYGDRLRRWNLTDNSVISVCDMGVNVEGLDDITTNASNTYPEFFWWSDRSAYMIRMINSTCGEVSSFSYSQTTNGTVFGLDTNDTIPNPNHFWLLDVSNTTVWVVDNNGNELAHYDLSSIWPTDYALRGLWVYPKGAPVSKLYITGCWISNCKYYKIFRVDISSGVPTLEDSWKLGVCSGSGHCRNLACLPDVSSCFYTDSNLDYKIELKKVSDTNPPVVSNHSLNVTYVIPSKGVNESAFVRDNECLIDTYTISSNASGTWEQEAHDVWGWYNDTDYYVEKTWQVLDKCDKKIEYKIIVNDTAGNYYEDTVPGYTLPYVVSSSNTNVIRRIKECVDLNNFTLQAVGNGNSLVNVYAPFITEDGISKCIYEASNSKWLNQTNTTEYCILYFATEELSTGDLIRVQKSVPLRVAPPPNLPAALTAALVGTIVVIYTVSIKRKSEGWK